MPKTSKTDDATKSSKIPPMKSEENQQEPSIKSSKKMKYEEIFKKREYLYGVGRRKTASAQARIYKNGKGRVYINKREYRKYFPNFEIQKIITKSAELLKERQNLDISVYAKGGGVRGQADAALLAISRALIKLDPEYREKLKQAGFLKTDARKKERKKPGLKRARRAPQWQKR